MPNYEGRNPYDAEKARVYLEKLIASKKNFRIVAHVPKRTGRQNRFFYAILGLISTSIGECSSDEIKTYVKVNLCRDIFYKGNKKIGKYDIENYRSTSDLNKSEFHEMVTRLMFFASSELGLYIPDPKDYWDEMEDENSTHDFSMIDQFIFYVGKIQTQYEIQEREYEKNDS